MMAGSIVTTGMFRIKKIVDHGIIIEKIRM